MSARSRKTPPPEVEAYVTRMTDALTAMSEGEDQRDALYRALDGAVRAAAARHSSPLAGMSHWTTFEASFSEVIGENLKAIREESGWTQAGVAEVMVSLGFDWKRITYAEVEACTRRVTFEELLGLAVLFAVPVLELLIPTEAPDNTTVLAWETGDLSASMVKELFIGHGGVLGQGGLTWRAAAQAAGPPGGPKSWRPAADLWRERSATDVKSKAAPRDVAVESRGNRRE